MYQLYLEDTGPETQDPNTQFLKAVQTFSKLEDTMAKGTLVPHYLNQQEEGLVYMYNNKLYYCFHEPYFFYFRPKGSHSMKMLSFDNTIWASIVKQINRVLHSGSEPGGKIRFC